MSQFVGPIEPQTDFEMGDVVEFNAPNSKERLQGTITRIYNTRTAYYADVPGKGRFYIRVDEDNIELVEKAG